MFYVIKIFLGYVSYPFLVQQAAYTKEKLMTRQLKMYFKGGNGMSDNGNNLPEIPFGNRDDANGMASQALQQWAERYYAKMVEEKQAEEEPSMLDQLLDKVGEYVDQEIEQLPAEEQEAAVMKLAETADTLVDTLDKAYTVTEKACDSIIDSLDELENGLISGNWLLVVGCLA